MRVVSAAVSAWALLGAAACSGQASAVQAAPDRLSDPASPFHAWQVLETSSGGTIGLDALLDRLATQDVVYLGEEHRNRHHVEAAAKVLRGLLARGARPILALEMFGWDGQEALDAYVSARPDTRARFLEESGWAQNWGGPFSDYEPLLQLAREQRLRVVALNPPRPLVRSVARKGLAQTLQAPEAARWDMRNESIVDDPEYREVLMRQLRQCHPGMPDAAYERIYEASMFRDEGMAKTIVEHLSRAAGEHRPIVSYTGGGHIQRGLPVPRRVARRTDGAVRQATVYLHAFEPDHPEHVRELLEEPVADYLWLTPIGEHGPPARC